ncbi:alanyl-tRNA synthetase [Parabacteroides sp. PF5-5]|uniref:alanine--tRNA ligase n=1 Tax=unclassified Parabacteroides TaxID=2649774 RepID=UPI002474DFBA|nr:MULTISPECIES: alanine--tRNA ligase [unclassified Parabacteroides]MDH6306421.1 alanyl-tRNA synthetase [Parabacteroides sp. PH5-39]MDH6317427.1 alanyl-tRNA synthetase [Parabacteroides sp. PF5-13]MDH6321132.1 alanyl-tRNA synthetase [Parabacteroides sp. PH5-13]MDH6324864.1 alanyl-tRNA synthetase [Parabacteroides sp. PH5-8]MDH6328612.1 alanyl-tRNA synthetase [Parabacteroides sp. PH5-41]
MLTAKETRESFKSFFASKQHQIVPSAPMVIKGDPTLMFTNAGMNQFKDIILGNVPIKYSRVADSQKCLRVSGKHNDLEEVGHDTYHHTMFEMLGNWSFGDYFKEDAIAWAWEYLVDVLKLNPANLYATVFEGSAAEGLERDNEAAGYWEKYLPKDHILNGNKKDNFWEMGDTGPCGPCSEVHIDLRPEEEKKQIKGADLINKDHPQVIEIWNLVFMQYNRKADSSLEPLPAKVIDTGMGFERLCMAVQGKTSNYDTDVFQPIIQKLAALAGVTYGKDKQKDIAMRVIADHIRTIAFSITDGQLPSNAKAGYVIRRILRRAVRYGYTFLDRRESFMYKLLPVLIETMGDAYPELIEQRMLIERVMKEEEESFLRTLETGIRLLDKKMEEAKAEGRNTLGGVDAFTLYDTFGFPLDLTELILREHGMNVDIAAFDAEMKQQKDRARNAAAVETSDWVVLKEGESRFVGYDFFESDAEILRYRKIKQKNKELYQIVLNETPFYAEKGGQVGDCGWLISDEDKVAVLDTKSENNLSVHLTERLPKDIAATFIAKVDKVKRRQCECNHTGTHLLHEALREVLGAHVEQRGSYVSPESLRFDFSHFQKVTDEEVRQIERLVGEKIRANYSLEEHRSLPIAKAKEMGAMALFGEKYGDEVRVVRYGSSVELCGGTHVPATGMIGSLRIVGESSIAAGIRRIEAVTAEGAENYSYNQQDMIRELRTLMNNMPNLVQAIKKSIEENADMKKQIEDYLKEKAVQVKAELVSRAVDYHGTKLIKVVTKGHAELMKDVAFQIKGELKDSFVLVAGLIEESKCTLMVMLSDDVVAEGHNAGKLVKDAAKHIQGGGGGQPHFATAGGKNADGLTIAVNSVVEALGLS